jgi:hypothetical protein
MKSYISLAIIWKQFHCFQFGSIVSLPYPHPHPHHHQSSTSLPCEKEFARIMGQLMDVGCKNWYTDCIQPGRIKQMSAKSARLFSILFWKYMWNDCTNLYPCSPLQYFLITATSIVLKLYDKNILTADFKWQCFKWLSKAAWLSW